MQQRRQQVPFQNILQITLGGECEYTLCAYRLAPPSLSLLPELL